MWHVCMIQQIVFSRFEDGTLPFLDIVALKHGFDVIEGFAQGIELISMHTFDIARYVMIMNVFICVFVGKKDKIVNGVNFCTSVAIDIHTTRTCDIFYFRLCEIIFHFIIFDVILL